MFLVFSGTREGRGLETFIILRIVFGIVFVSDA